MAASDAELIGARSTAPGPAAIAIFRLSGPGALDCARGFVVGLQPALVARTLVRAFVVDEKREPLDEVLVAWFPAGHSFTGEELVEIHCHGSPAVVDAVGRLAWANGARQATPGEFTARAVRHGTLDLLDAEALATLLWADDAQSLEAARAALQAKGPLRELIQRAKAALVEARGFEDYPIETSGSPSTWRETATAVREALRPLCEGSPSEAAVRDGVRVALLGPPNAGKSSLLNALAEAPRALVDDVPGTTRDAQWVTVFLDGRRVSLIDTAGLRAAEGLEQRGIERGLLAAQEADLRVWIEDGSAPPSVRPAELDVALTVLAKSDLGRHPARPASLEGCSALSVKTGSGVREFRATLAAQATRVAARGSSGLSRRQQRLVGEAVAALAGLEAAEDALALAQLARALECLDGLVAAPKGVDAASVYERFCIGK